MDTLHSPTTRDPLHSRRSLPFASLRLCFLPLHREWRTERGRIGSASRDFNQRPEEVNKSKDCYFFCFELSDSMFVGFDYWVSNEGVSYNWARAALELILDISWSRGVCFGDTEPTELIRKAFTSDSFFPWIERKLLERLFIFPKASRYSDSRWTEIGSEHLLCRELWKRERNLHKEQRWLDKTWLMIQPDRMCDFEVSRVSKKRRKIWGNDTTFWQWEWWTHQWKVKIYMQAIQELLQKSSHTENWLEKECVITCRSYNRQLSIFKPVHQSFDGDSLDFSVKSVKWLGSVRFPFWCRL